MKFKVGDKVKISKHHGNSSVHGLVVIITETNRRYYDNSPAHFPYAVKSENTNYENLMLAKELEPLHKHQQLMLFEL